MPARLEESQLRGGLVLRLIQQHQVIPAEKVGHVRRSFRAGVSWHDEFVVVLQSLITTLLPNRRAC